MVNPLRWWNLNLMERAVDSGLVIVTDECGEMIAHNASANWLFENLEDRRQLPVDRYMEKTCRHVIPTGPKTNRY